MAEPSTTDNSTHFPRSFDSMSGELSNQVNQSQQSKYSTRKAIATQNSELENRKSQIKTIRNQVGEQRAPLPQLRQAAPKTTNESRMMRNGPNRTSKDR
jgi:hypothetical protein